MTGFNNNVNAITEKIANGSIKVTREGNINLLDEMMGANC